MSWRRSMFLLGFSKKYGRMLLGLWLVLFGLFALFPEVTFRYQPVLMALLAIVAGILVFLDR
jgi:hypothetical protein